MYKHQRKLYTYVHTVHMHSCHGATVRPRSATPRRGARGEFRLGSAAALLCPRLRARAPRAVVTLRVLGRGARRPLRRRLCSRLGPADSCACLHAIAAATAAPTACVDGARAAGRKNAAREGALTCVWVAAT